MTCQELHFKRQVESDKCTTPVSILTCVSCVKSDMSTNLHLKYENFGVVNQEILLIVIKLLLYIGNFKCF